VRNILLNIHNIQNCSKLYIRITFDISGCDNFWTTYEVGVLLNLCILLLLLLLLLLTAIELSLGGSSPYTSTDKTNNNA